MRNSTSGRSVAPIPPPGCAWWRGSASTRTCRTTARSPLDDLVAEHFAGGSLAADRAEILSDCRLTVDFRRPRDHRGPLPAGSAGGLSGRAQRDLPRPGDRARPVRLGAGQRGPALPRAGGGPSDRRHPPPPRLSHPAARRLRLALGRHDGRGAALGGAARQRREGGRADRPLPPGRDRLRSERRLDHRHGRGAAGVGRLVRHRSRARRPERAGRGRRPAVLLPARVDR
jgi:hypothetical protein